MTDLNLLGKQAVAAKYEMQLLGTQEKNHGLLKAAEKLLEKREEILSANERDIRRGEENGMHPGLIDRLRLNDARIEAMAEGLRQIVELPDPIGEEMEAFVRPNGLKISRVRVPLGVIGIIYESRPNVTADAFGLCFKSGNAVILKGGSDAIESNIAIAKVLREALEECGLNRDAVLLIEDTDREITKEFMRLNNYVDVLIPRGSAGLIRTVVENSTIPVIETGSGNCHIYVDKDADIEKAVPIIVNAKTQRIGVCNACESLVVHEKISEKLLPELSKALREKNVEIRADKQAMAFMTDCMEATEEDFAKEYLDYIISVKTVSDVKEAIAHINKNNTRHSEAIARGPMGLKELTSYQYRILGEGQIRP